MGAYIIQYHIRI
jgi:hypothetical protein